jgi:hypothetical protein
MATTDVDQYYQWLQPAFAWFDTSWPDDLSWEEAKDHALTTIGLSSAELQDPANRVAYLFIEHVERLDETARRDVLTNENERYGVLYQACQQAAAENPGPGDGSDAVGLNPGELWSRLVAEGSDWSAWDGSDEGWAQWRDHFYQLAAALGGPQGEELARQQIGWAETSSLADRVAGLQQQGLTVTGAAAALAAQQEQARATVDELVQTNIDTVIDGALAALNIDAALAAHVKPLVQERLEETAASQPELFAGLGPEELENLRNQLRDELESELRNAMQPATQ